MGASPFNTLVHLLNPFKRKGFMDAEREMNTCTLLSVKVSENPLLFDSFSFPNELLHHWKLTSNQEPTATQCPRAIPGCSSISIWWHHQEILKFYLVRLPKLRTLGNVSKLYILKTEVTYLTFLSREEKALPIAM